MRNHIEVPPVQINQLNDELGKKWCNLWKELCSRGDVIGFVVLALGGHGEHTVFLGPAGRIVTVVVDDVVLFVAGEFAPLRLGELGLGVPRVAGVGAAGDVAGVGRLHGAVRGRIGPLVGGAHGAAVHAVEALVCEREGRV